jgi:hypothetical protein
MEEDEGNEGPRAKAVKATVDVLVISCNGSGILNYAAYLSSVQTRDITNAKQGRHTNPSIL